ncbi:MAG: AAA family ATPase [Actinomycetota bacterium]|nr:AAA family ATPase [Actinomycetota bacterium]MDA8357558.1 AAA family ATPase [Actinomycetota bacterium]
MKLLRLTVENFRQFYGSQVIEFAAGRDDNVTVVYGANGAGKTTLLNAFTWALYGKVTPDFEQPDRLVNSHLMAGLADGEEGMARVVLEFEHDHNRYRLQREIAEGNGPNGRRTKGRENLRLTFTDEGGSNYEQRDNPGEAIDRILPERLHQFFFFNGERIEHLADPSAFEEIEEAIKTLLGLAVIERAIQHLPQVRRNLEAELKKVGTPEVSKLTERIERCEADQEARGEDLAQERRNLAALDGELEEIEDRLRHLAEARSLQEQRDRATQDLRRADDRLKSLRVGLAEVINDRGFLAFVAALSEKAQVMFGELRTKGEIPTPMKRQFVDDLLEHGTCICGTPLTPGSPPHDHVAEWRRRVGLADVEETWTRISAHTEEFAHERAALGHDLDRLIGDLAATRGERKRLEEQLSEVSRNLEHFPSEEVQGLETRRVQVRRKRDETQRRIGDLEGEIKRLDRDLQEATQQRARADAQSAKEKVAKHRVEVVEAAAKLFQQVLDLRTHDVREQLDAKIREVYSAITYKPYQPELGEDFRLTLRDAGGVMPVAKSTGENQILSLSFVGALAALARHGHEETWGSLFTTSGGIFPIVMDAPFGTLDETPRREVARGLPQLAPQVVIFVTKAQGLGAAEEELRPRVGRSWVIYYLTPKGDVTPESIELSFGSVPYVDLATDGVERAEIVEAT